MNVKHNEDNMLTFEHEYMNQSFRRQTQCSEFETLLPQHLGIVNQCKFSQCTFHRDCWSVLYQNCVFERCDQAMLDEMVRRQPESSYLWVYSGELCAVVPREIVRKEYAGWYFHIWLDDLVWTPVEVSDWLTSWETLVCKSL